MSVIPGTVRLNLNRCQCKSDMHSHESTCFLCGLANNADRSSVMKYIKSIKMTHGSSEKGINVGEKDTMDQS